MSDELEKAEFSVAVGVWQKLFNFNPRARTAHASSITAMD